MSSAAADLLTQITDLFFSSEEDRDLAEAVTSVVASARQFVSGSDFTVSLAPVAAIGSFLMIVGLTPIAGLSFVECIIILTSFTDQVISSCPLETLLLVPEPGVWWHQQDGHKSRHSHQEAGWS